MSDDQEVRYKVTFLGPVENDIPTVTKLAGGLKDQFKLSDEAVTRMMKMVPVVIKVGVTLSEAEKYKKTLEALGAKIQIDPIETVPEEPQQTKLTSPPPAEAGTEQKTKQISPSPAEAGREQQAIEEPPPPVEAGTEQEVKEEGPAPLDREPQVIPVKAKTPPPESPKTVASQETKETEPQMVQCPQCGYVQEQTDECIKCGVIISKVLKYQDAVKPPGVEAASPGTATPSLEGPQVQPIIGTPMDEPTSSTPWEDMASLGFTTAFFRTIKQVFSIPDIFFRRMPVNNGILNPLLFGIIAGYVGALINFFWQYTFSGMLGGGLNFAGVSPVIIYAFILPIIIIIGLFIGSIIIHISVMMFGGKRGFEATFRVFSFANSIQVVSVVPLLGAIFFLVYYPVLIVVGLKESHRITMGRAAFAVFVSIIIGVIIIGGIFLLLFVTVFAAFMGSMIPQQPPPGF